MKKLLTLLIASYASAIVVANPVCPPSLTNSINISNGTNHYEGSTLYYAVVPSSPSDANNGILCGRLEVLNNDGSWIGIGISTNYNMFGSEAIIGLPIDTLSQDVITKQNTVMKYKLGGYTVGYEVGGWGVYYMAEEKQTLTNTSLVLEETENGDELMIMTFTKLLIEDEEIPIKEKGTNVFLFASGTSPELGPHADYGVSFTKDFSEDIVMEEEEDINIPTEQQPDDSQTNPIDSTISEQVAESGEEDVSVVEQPAQEEVATDNTNPAPSLCVECVLYSVLICTLVGGIYWR
jgi:hypothetical protein